MASKKSTMKESAIFHTTVHTTPAEGGFPPFLFSVGKRAELVKTGVVAAVSGPKERRIYHRFAPTRQIVLVKKDI